MDSSKGKTLFKNEAIVIELVGPPGAGKTTSCNCFSALLRDKGIKVLLLQDVKDYIRDLNYYRKGLLLLKTLLFRGHTLLSYTGSLASSRIYSSSSIYRYFRLLVFDQVLKKILKTKDIDIVLLEQWTIQEMWSATIFKLQSYDKVKDKLNKFYFKTDYVLYFDIDAETASERIAKRNTNLSRFDRMEPDERLKELIKYNTYLYQLYENSACSQKYVFSTVNNLSNNAELFMQRLELFPVTDSM